ncbi:MAG: hypothetical protein IPP73_04960 [Chitinophagaceae bacterium]|nr:hypothetical protein [Chitinophagaceae bacterium]
MPDTSILISPFFNSNPLLHASIPKSLSVSFSFLLIFGCCQLYAQRIDSLNTAANCQYMTEPEREMLYEINRLRSNPKSYLEYLLPMLKDAKDDLKVLGKGNRNYSLTFSSTVKNGKEVKRTDTTWHYTRKKKYGPCKAYE